MDIIQKRICKNQGQLFELSAIEGINSKIFIKSYMDSKTAARFDSEYSRLQMAPRGYVLEELEGETGALPRDGKVWNRDAMFWIGYAYRFWHFYKKASSPEIYAIADAERMLNIYGGYHTLSFEMAIDRLLESDREHANLSRHSICM